MIYLPPIIERIKKLLAEDTPSSATYAALEARLALEKICYDRLRQRHDYISHDQLTRWQPGGIINQLITDVDEHAAGTVILSIGSPTSKGVKPEDDEYTEVGTQIGFNAKLIVKMWNALSRLALHVKLPENRNDHIPEYGDQEAIKAKVEEVIVELERLAKGTMVFSGFGPEVSFSCQCGKKNKRRASLLKEGQSVFCVNPECKASYKVTQDGDEFCFEAELTTVNCEKCDKLNAWPVRTSYSMKCGQTYSFKCHSCEFENLVMWRLMRRGPDNSGSGMTSPPS